MLIKNARLRDQQGLWQIQIENGTIHSISPNTNDQAFSGNILDAEYGLVVPPFIEPHVHLDTTLTAGQPRWNESGTLFEGIERWAERKQRLSPHDVKERAITTLKWQAAQGIQYVRSHVDITDPALTALKTLLEVKAQIAPWMELQLVAFPQEGIQSYPQGAELLEEALRLGADVVGGIPHYEFTREYGVDSVNTIFKLAAKYDRLIDIHCDEIDDEQSRFIEVVAAEAYRHRMGNRVTASHTTAMHSYNNAYTFKLFNLLKLSGINFVANPLVNIHLQGRFDTYPKRRGITRVKELWEAGINICFGHDDILDPWYPLGTGNMLQVLHMGLHACQLMGYSQLNRALDLITVNSARTLNISDRYGITEGKPANLVILPADNCYDALRRQIPVRYSLRQGQIIAETKPSTTTLHWNTEKSETITFKTKS
ncbi:Cytosine deaminase [Sporomusa ovata DSM 2662]|uniref:Cytosine deaminase n=1 Tax=Sporomusa ovata TaxID=2378 RepID=A0A0U1KX13_9FIRM|nr:cytosine deaminase [Sporomusa ovata]EQB28798.1 cytosine deaminase [Sporomusa ovata DSM 2662]CQR71957.1 Cytosine deaminase [Sporomusa ovata]